MKHPLHEEADKAEPRLARAIHRGLLKVKTLVNVNDLAMAIHAGDVRRAMALVMQEPVMTDMKMDDCFAPVGTICRDSILRGAKLTEKTVNEAQS